LPGLDRPRLISAPEAWKSSIRYHEFMAGAIKIGVAGWSYQDWANVVYPASLKAAQRLGYLAEFFNLVEINLKGV